MSEFIELSCLLCGSESKECSSIEIENQLSLLQNTVAGGTLTTDFDNNSWATYFCKLFKLPTSSYEDKLRGGLYCQNCSVMLNSIYSISSTIEDLHRQLNLLKLNIEDVLMKNPRLFGFSIIDNPTMGHDNGLHGNFPSPPGELSFSNQCLNNNNGQHQDSLDLDIEGIFKKLVLNWTHPSEHQSSFNLPFNFNTDDFNDEAAILLGGQSNDLLQELDDCNYQLDFIPSEDQVSPLSCEDSINVEVSSSRFQSQGQTLPEFCHGSNSEPFVKGKETSVVTASASVCEIKEVSCALQKLTSEEIEKYTNGNSIIMLKKSPSYNITENGYQKAEAKVEAEAEEKDEEKLEEEEVESSNLPDPDSCSNETCSKIIKDESEFYRKCRNKLHEGVKKPYECNDCGQCFKAPAYLKDHQNFHTGKKPHRCSSCNVHFHTTNCLKSHVRTVHREKEGVFRCEVCHEDSFPTKVDLNVHRSFHPELNLIRLQCSVCAKTLRSARNLRNHMKTHDGSSPFPCTVCPFRCSSRTKLEEHTERHNSEKKIPCPEPECSKLFNCRANLKNHMATHNQKTYECQTCKKFFKTKDQLKRHEGIHSGTKPFLCYVCGKAYAVRTYLTIHLRSHKKINKNGHGAACSGSSMSMSMATPAAKRERERGKGAIIN